MKYIVVFCVGLFTLVSARVGPALPSSPQISGVASSQWFSYAPGLISAFALPAGCGSNAYRSLLAAFPEGQEGQSYEVLHPGIWEQPMVYALLLSAESLRQQTCPNMESVRRIREAAFWLLAHLDLNQDGAPGWGLPWAWDVFSDGTINAANESYTITTALVIEGFLDTLRIRGFWTNMERAKLLEVIATIAQRWTHDVWHYTEEGGYFLFSPHPNDRAYAIPNVSAMMVGVLARFLTEYPATVSLADRRILWRYVDEGAAGVNVDVQLRDGAPFWRYWHYFAPPTSTYKDGPNNLVHHVYVIYGMELYRHYRGATRLSWDTRAAAVSLERFVHDGRMYDVPQDAIERPSDRDLLAVLWSAASLVAWEAAWGDLSIADEHLGWIMRDYGPWPSLRLSPDPTTSTTFYARHGAHILWAVALREFRSERGPRR